MNGTSNKSPISGKRGRKVYVIYENVNAGGGGGVDFALVWRKIRMVTKTRNDW